jgi:hypothetical protein
METRYCKHCSVEHPLTKEHWFFRKDGASPTCKVYKLAKNAEWVSKNKEHHKELCKRWNEENVEKRRQQGKEYWVANKDRVYARNLKNEQLRRENDPSFRMAQALRSRVRSAFKRRNGNKTVSGVKDLGCSVAELAKYLESKFYANMSFDNYGKVWEIDHIKPLAKYDLTNPETAKELMHYTNLQPLLIEDNRRKHAKVPSEWQHPRENRAKSVDVETAEAGCLGAVPTPRKVEELKNLDLRNAYQMNQVTDYNSGKSVRQP